MVPVVDLLAVGEELAGTDNVLELCNPRLWVVAAASVHVAVEHAGVAVRAEENERVRQRLEPGWDPVLERLADLSVVLV